MNFPEILKELREEKNVTRTTVALNCNVSTQCISSLEMGTRNPTSSTLMALADYFFLLVEKHGLHIQDPFQSKYFRR